MPKHIYYNIFKGSYIREPKYMKKKESNRKKTPKKLQIASRRFKCAKV